MEGKSNIFGILCFIVSRKVNMQLKCKKKKKHCAVYGQNAMIEHIKSGLQSFMLKISCWTMLHYLVEQLKLTTIKSRH